MIVHGLENIEELPEGEIHLAIGNFDGVHLGHQKLIDAAMEAARKSKGISVVLTFWPHPTVVLKKQNAVLTIMSPEIKNHFLEERGVDVVIQERFTEDFAMMRARKFVELLKETFPGLRAVYAGEDFHFGHKKEGDLEFLKKEGEELGFSVVEEPYEIYKGEIISSSRIRKALLEGKIEDANEMLGYAYYSTGLVIEKETKGEYPTLDIVWRPELKPRYGVYAIRAKAGKGKELKGIGHYGVESTINDNTDPTLQIYLFETQEWEVGDLITVEWLHFIRGEERFESKEAFEKQIRKDIEEAKDTLKYLF